MCDLNPKQKNNLMMKILQKYIWRCFFFVVFLCASPLLSDTTHLLHYDFILDIFRHSEIKHKFLLPSKALPYDVDFSSVGLDLSSFQKKPICFVVKNIEFIPLDRGQKDTTTLLKKFSYKDKIAKPYLNTCIGTREINTLLNQLNIKTIKEGYITTKFGLVPQDLSNNTLKIGIDMGFVGEIEYINGGKMLSFSKDFGIKRGDILNLKVIELGITNLKRLRYLSNTSQIIPMNQNSMSKIVINSVRKSLPFFVQVLFDNGGSIKKGYETTFLLGIENPLRLADSLQIYLLGSLPFLKTDHSYYASVSYSVPIRRLLLQVDTSYAHNANQLLFYGISPIYSGYSINADIKATYLLYADAKNQLSFGLGASGRFSDNYLENIKLDVQTTRLTEASAFMSYKRYVSNSTFDIILSLIQGVPLFGSNKSFDKKITYTYTIPSLNLYLYHPFDIWKNIFIYSSTIKTQISRDQLYASEKMTIGGRYSVRGFNHFSLSGQMGVLYRNDLKMYLPSFWGVTLAPALGADMGYVRDITQSNEPAGFLSGGGIGIELLSKYFNAQVWGYTPFYNPYNAPTQNLYFSIGLTW